ncbi:MAG: HDOD domain-containing protein [bacterium]
MNVDEAIAKIEDIPTLPTTLAEVLRTTSSENGSVKELSQIIYSDQSLTTKILKMANSSFYGFVHQIRSVDRAIVILGFDEVRAIAIAVSIFDSVYLRKGGVYYSRIRSWNHSLLCALGTRLLAGIFGKSKNLGPELFVGGLIHDIGKVFMDRYFPESFVKVLELVEETSLTMESAEREVFGFDHALLAGALLRKWKFPEQLTDIVMYHHHPELARANKGRIALICMADLMCHQLGYSTYTCEPRPSLRESFRSKMLTLAQNEGELLTPRILIASLRKLKERTAEVDHLSRSLFPHECPEYPEHHANGKKLRDATKEASLEKGLASP